MYTNKNSLFVLGEKTPVMNKISEILDKAELSFVFATVNNKPVNKDNKNHIDSVTDISFEQVIYIDCSEEVPSFEYATCIFGENLMNQFLELLYLDEMFKAGIIKYDPGMQRKTLGRVIKQSILIDGEKEWLIDYMDFCAVSPIPDNIKQFLGEI